MRVQEFASGTEWAFPGWPQPSDVRALGGGPEVAAARNALGSEQHFKTYTAWFQDVFSNAQPKQRADAGFAWRRDTVSGDGTLLWCTGVSFEMVMMRRFEACALLQSACSCTDAETALDMRAGAAIAFDKAARASAEWGTDGDRPRCAWSELTEKHNRDCALLSAIVTHATALLGASGSGDSTSASAEALAARCGALAACHSELAGHSDAHDPGSAPCVAIAVACSVLALDTLVSNAERHLKLCDAASAGACALRARELLSTVAVPEPCGESVERRAESVLYIAERVVRERVPFNARMLASPIELPKLY
jgi:hypothetical protein